MNDVYSKTKKYRKIGKLTYYRYIKETVITLSNLPEKVLYISKKLINKNRAIICNNNNN